MTNSALRENKINKTKQNKTPNSCPRESSSYTLHNIWAILSEHRLRFDDFDIGITSLMSTTRRRVLALYKELHRLGRAYPDAK
jgi:hypothetical protein